MAARREIAARFWTQMDRATAHLTAQRWDSAIAVLEPTIQEIASNREHFRSVRLSTECRHAVQALAYAYARTGRWDDAWRTLEEVSAHDLLGDLPPRVDQREAAFDVDTALGVGLRALMSLLTQGIDEVETDPPRVAPPPPRRVLHDARTGSALLQILMQDKTMVMLLRTLGEDGKQITNGVLRDVDDKIAAALEAFAGTTSADVLNYLRSLDWGVVETALARARMAAAFARVAPFFVEPLQELLRGQRLRAIGICDDGKFNTFPFEALPWPEPTARGQLLGDHYDVYFLPSAASGMSHRTWQPREKPRVLFVAYDGADLGTDRDIAQLREFTGLNVTVMHTADCAKREILSELSKDYSLIHFACHGRFDRIQPNRSALLLSEKARDVQYQDSQGRSKTEAGDQRYQLTIEDLQGIRMSGAPVVSLFACSSAAPSSTMKFGFSGLSGAFLRAGASAVIGSRWSASNDLCFTLLSTMFAAINDGAPPATAFFAARRALPRTPEQNVFHQGLFCYIGTLVEETP
jgi:hypothetical protein